MDLATFGIQRLEAFVLILARTAGIFTLAPIFGANQVPVLLRVAIALGMTLVFVPLYSGEHLLAWDALPMALMIAKETLVGLVIGFVVMLIFAAMETAGQFVDLQAGFSFATMLDPVYGSQTAVAARFHRIVAGLLFFVTNGHHIMIRGIADSFTIMPIGDLTLDAAVAGGVAALFANLFAVAAKVAAPVVAAVFLADVALAVVARAVPQMNVLIAGFPLKLGVGLIGMLMAVSVVATSSEGLFADMYGQTANLLGLLIGH